MAISQVHGVEQHPELESEGLEAAGSTTEEAATRPQTDPSGYSTVATRTGRQSGRAHILGMAEIGIPRMVQRRDDDLAATHTKAEQLWNLLDSD